MIQFDEHVFQMGWNQQLHVSGSSQIKGLWLGLQVLFLGEGASTTRGIIVSPCSTMFDATLPFASTNPHFFWVVGFNYSAEIVTPKRMWFIFPAFFKLVSDDWGLEDVVNSKESHKQYPSNLT